RPVRAPREGPGPVGAARPHRRHPVAGHAQGGRHGPGRGRRHPPRTDEYLDNKFKGLVEDLAFHPRGDWLLAAGGANDGFLLFYAPGRKKALRQEKVPLHVHAAPLGEGAETVYAAGNGRIMTFEMKG
ncbi:MAG: hypothetical protein ACJ8H8_09300, partial [Geminicoccaceae bacterium]